MAATEVRKTDRIERLELALMAIIAHEQEWGAPAGLHMLIEGAKKELEGR